MNGLNGTIVLMYCGSVVEFVLVFDTHIRKVSIRRLREMIKFDTQSGNGEKFPIAGGGGCAFKRQGLMGYAGSGNNVDAFLNSSTSYKLKVERSSSSSSPPLKRETNSNQIVIERLSV